MKRKITSVVRRTPPTVVRAAVLVFSALLAVATGSAAAATTYSTTMLQRLPSTYRIAINAIGPRGVVVGQSHYELANNSPVLWNESGQIIELTPGFTGSITSFYAADIDTAGQVLLQADAPYFWMNGTLTPVNLGLEGTVVAFNDAGQIVGNFTSTNEAFISSNGVTTLLGLPSSPGSSTPRDINNKGQVIANHYSDRFRALFWENGMIVDLGALPGDTQSFASAVNEAGQIVGSSSTSLQQGRAVLWEHGVIRDLGGSEYGARVGASDINNVGQIVGAARSASGANTSLLWSNGVITNLNPVLGQAAEQCRAVGINDGGQIAVLCSNAYDDVAYRLNPVAAGSDVGVVVTPSTTSVTVGGALTYNVTVTNAGALTVSGVTLTDVLPAGVNFVSAAPSQGSCSGTTTVVCALGDLANGASASVQIGVVPTVAGTLTNLASVAINETDVNALNDDAKVVVSATAPGADLGVTLTDSPDPVQRRTDLTYAISVRNTGPGAASAVTVTDTLPSSMAFVSATSSQGSCSGSSTVTCDLGSLANGANASVTIVARPRFIGTYTNTVTVRSSTADGNSANNSATVKTTVR